MTQASERVHLPGLTGIRALAALGVVLGHTEQFHRHAGLPNVADAPGLAILADQCVVLFFVLSGFLITWLLLAEQERTGSIRVGAFYVRRILRIWPLYYTVVAAGFLVVPFVLSFAPFDANRDDSPGMQLLLHLFLLPNAALILYGHVLLLGPLWSIGVEEQFYAVWPWLMRKARRPIEMLLALLAGIVGLRVVLAATMPGLAAVLHHLAFEAMVLGGLAAVLCARPAGRRAMVRPGVLIGAVAGTALLLGTKARFGAFDHLIYGSLFAAFIGNAAHAARGTRFLEHPLLRALGVRSYGVYLWHSIGIVVGIDVAQSLLGPRADIAMRSLAVYPVAFGVAIGLAHLSYVTIERPFLRIKERYAIVASAMDSHEANAGSAGEAGLERSADARATTAL